MDVHTPGQAVAYLNFFIKSGLKLNHVTEPCARNWCFGGAWCAHPDGELNSSLLGEEQCIAHHATSTTSFDSFSLKTEFVKSYVTDTTHDEFTK